MNSYSKFKFLFSASTGRIGAYILIGSISLLPGFAFATHTPAITLAPASASCLGTAPQILLSWTDDFHLASTTFLIFRQIPGQTSYTQIGSTTSNTFTDTAGNGLVSDKSYRYQVKATEDTKTAFSNEVNVGALYCAPVLSAPAPSCAADGPHVSLSWTGISGSLNTYEIYRDGVKIGSTAATSFNDGPNLAGTKSYNYFVRSTWQDTTFRDSATASVTAPACAPSLTASAQCAAVAPGGPKVDLSWNNLLGVQSYQIYRKAQSAVGFTLLDTVPGSSSSYTDFLVNSLPATYLQGGTSSYFVKAIWSVDQKDSNTVAQAIPQCPPFLSVESNCDEFSFRLKWTATKDAAHYNVYREGSFLAQKIGITSISHTDFLDLVICPGKICTKSYKVDAVGGFGTLSSNIASKSIDCTTIIPPSPAPVLADPVPFCELGNPKISLSWSPSDNVHYYTVYRNGVGVISVANTSYIDLGIESGFTYTYSVTAFGAGGTFVNSANTKTLTALSCTPPTVPILRNLSSTCSAGLPIVNLSWTNSPEALSYEIHRGLSSTSLSLLTTFDSATPEFTSRTWTDTGVSTSITYYYKVVAKGLPGGPTSSSDVKAITTLSCLPYTPFLFLSSACEFGSPVANLYWSTTQANTSYYEIFREDFSLTNPIQVILNPALTSWKDTSVAPEKIYKYKVDAVGPTGARVTEGYKSITSFNCAPPGSFTLSLATAPYCAESYLRSKLSWTSSSNSTSYNLSQNKLNADNTIAQTTTHSNVSSPFTEIGLGNGLNFSSDLVNFGGFPGPPGLSVNTALGAKNTVEFWMKWDGSDYNTLFSWESEYALWFYGGCFGFGSYWNVYGIPSSGLAGKWVHVAAVFYNGIVDSTTNELYINGVKQSISFCAGWGSFSRSVTSDAQIGIGLAYPFYYYYYYGMLDEMRIYKRALTATEIAEHYQGIYTNNTDLIGRWHMDEGSGQVASDSTNFANNGRLGWSTAADSGDPIWAVSGLQSQQKYNWQAEAFGPGGSAKSNTTSPVTAPMCVPSKPGVHLSAQCGPGSISVKWAYSIHATGYNIYRNGVKLTPPSPASQSPDSSVRTFLDNNGGAGFPNLTTYTYKVDAVGTAGTVSSDVGSITTYDCSPPGIPINVTASFACPGGSSFPEVTIAWSDITNTNYYEITRSDGMKFGPITDTNAPSYTYVDGNPDPLVGTTYSYTVKAFGPGGASGSSVAAVISNTAANYCIPSTPAITSLTTACLAGHPENTISWYDATPFNTSTYDIFRNTTSTPPASPIAAITPTDLEFATRTWKDSGPLSSLTAYYYWVKAIGPKGDSPFSAVSSVTTFGCVPPAAPVMGIADICTNSANPITLLNWNKTAETNSYQVSKNGSPMASFSHSSDGSIRHWFLLGPFVATDISPWLNSQMIAALAYNHIGQEFQVRPRAGETASATTAEGSFAGTATWFNYDSLGDFINFESAFGSLYYKVAYAFAYVNSPTAQTLQLRTDGGHGIKVILNGAEVFSRYENYWDTPVKDQNVVNVNLNAGFNTLLVKVVEMYPWYGWGFYARFTDAGGSDILNNVSGWDSAAVTGTSAIYKVQAIGPGGTSPASNQVTSVPSDCTPAKPNVAINQQCSAGDSQLKVAWGLDLNTQYWKVYKKRQGVCIPADATFTVLPPSTSYTDGNVESSILYEYCVEAVGSALSTFSDAVSATAPFCFASPSTPVITVTPVCSGFSSRMQITWTGDVTGNTLSYNVWRKNVTAGEPDFSKIAAGVLSTATAYLDIVNEGNTYVYKLEAVGAGTSNFAFSAESPPSTALLCSILPPDPPSLNLNFSPAPVAGTTFSISIRWTDSMTESGYKIFRDGVNITANLPAVCSQAGTGGDINCIDSFSLIDGKTYQYEIRAFNVNGETLSNPLSVVMPIAQPGAITLTGSQTAGGSVQLTWNAVATTAAGGTVTYTVERDNTSDFSTTIIPGCQNITVLGCEDGVPSGAEPWYRVRAQNLGGQSFSNPIRIVVVTLPEKWREISPF